MSDADTVLADVLARLSEARIVDRPVERIRLSAFAPTGTALVLPLLDDDDDDRRRLEAIIWLGRDPGGPLEVLLNPADWESLLASVGREARDALQGAERLFGIPVVETAAAA